MPSKEIQKISIKGAIWLLTAVIALVGLRYGSDEALIKIAKIVASIALAVFGISNNNE